MTAAPSPAEIAAKLSEAQRRCVFLLSEKEQIASRDSFNHAAAFNLIRKGVTKMGFDRRVMRDTFRLTKLGLAVRAIIEEGGDV